MKNIIGRTIALSDILLDNIKLHQSNNEERDRSETIRKAVDFYLKKVRIFLENPNNNEKKGGSDKKQGRNMNIIACGLTNKQLSEINSLIPRFSSSLSEFIRVAIFDYLVNYSNDNTSIQKQLEKDKIRIEMQPGIYKEFRIIKKVTQNENQVSKKA